MGNYFLERLMLILIKTILIKHAIIKTIKNLYQIFINKY